MATGELVSVAIPLAQPTDSTTVAQNALSLAHLPVATVVALEPNQPRGLPLQAISRETQPSTLAVQGVPINPSQSTVPGSRAMMIIERRGKQLGKDTKWSVYLNGAFVDHLLAAQSIQVGVAKGDVVTMLMRGAKFHLKVQDVSQGTLRFRAKTVGDVGFTGTGFVDKQWIEPCKRDNPDLDRKAVVFRKESRYG